MDQNVDLFSQISNDMEADVAALSPISNGFYRSRIYSSNISINPLIVACDPILTLIATLKTIEYPTDRNRFIENLAHEIRAFEHRALHANYPENIITAARYALCCLLDETISLTSEWGKNDGWLHNNLLAMFHNENYGGKYFFTIVSNALKNIPQNLHLIELLYLCLSFGFAGKYRDTKHGKNGLASVTNNLYQAICQHRRANSHGLFVYDPEVQTQAQLEQDYPIPQIKTVKLLSITAALALIISGMIYFSIHLKLHNISQPLYQQIEHSININSKDENQLL
jgi:type VI secretion system protein ImpK